MGSQQSVARKRAEEVRRVLDSLRNLVRILRLSERHAERAHGISAAQMFVLHCLGDGDGISLAELASRTVTDQSSVSVAVQKLVDNGLVVKTQASDDARRVVISLTAAGRRVLRRRTPTPQRNLIEAINELPATERRRLAASLEAITKSMHAGNAGPAPMFFEDSPRGRRKP